MPIGLARTRPEAVAEASAWFVEFRVGDLTAGTRARFDEWLRRSPENIQAYLEVAAGWSELPTADPESRLDLQSFVARARASSDGNVVRMRRKRTAQHPIRSNPRAWALAAGIAIAAILLGAGSWISSHRGEYRTGVGEQRTLTLADGSTIILNALTRIRVRFSKRRREVDLLSGQAYFHDTDDPRRPFIVRSGDATVRAIGTQFDVYSRSTGEVVTVVEGEVTVGNASANGTISGPSALGAHDAPRSPPQSAKPVLVRAGQQVVLDVSHVPAPRPVDVSAATAWIHQRLIFDDTPLEQVAAQFNLYSSRRLLIEDATLRRLGISGVYSSADPNSIIGFLRAQPHICVIEADGEIRVSLRKQK